MFGFLIYQNYFNPCEQCPALITPNQEAEPAWFSAAADSSKSAQVGTQKIKLNRTIPEPASQWALDSRVESRADPWLIPWDNHPRRGPQKAQTQEMRRPGSSLESLNNRIINFFLLQIQRSPKVGARLSQNRSD